VSGEPGAILARVRLPQPHGLIVSARGRDLAVRRERHGRHGGAVLRVHSAEPGGVVTRHEPPQFLGGANIPEAHRLLLASGHQHAPIGRKSDTGDLILQIDCEDADFPTARHVHRTTAALRFQHGEVLPSAANAI
jgi:hypothetical protein